MPHSFANLSIINHPLIVDKLTQMRMVSTPKPRFRQLLKEITMLMGYEVTRDMTTKDVEIETPLTRMSSPRIAGEMLAVVPILRAGLGMAEGLLDLVPEAFEGHIGMYRDPDTKQPVEYLVKLPPVDNRMFILVDPMLATGNSAVAGVDILVNNKVPVKNIRFLSLVASPEGVRTFNESYPQIPIYTAALDEKLDDHAYIVPGLGDAGDRLFGTL